MYCRVRPMTEAEPSPQKQSAKLFFGGLLELPTAYLRHRVLPRAAHGCCISFPGPDEADAV